MAMESTQPHHPDKRSIIPAELWQIGLVLLFAVAYIAAVGQITFENTRSSDWDQRAFLRVALWIANGDPMTDGNVSPLYPLLLSPFASRDIAFFTTAKIISLVIASSTLFVVYYTARRYVGIGGAFLVLLLLFVNGEYRRAAGFIDVEVLFVPLFVLGWQFLISNLKSITVDKRSLALAILAGVFVGLAQLTKGSAMLLMAAFGAALLLLRPLSWWRNRSFWITVATFAIVVFPLWLVNFQLFGSPTYNINTTRYMWLDSWEEGYVYDEAELPTAVSYVQTHSPDQIQERLVNGLKSAPAQWYNAAKPHFLPESRRAAFFAGLAALGGLVLIGYFVRQNRAERRTPFLLSAIGSTAFFLMFGWYHPISNDPRFVLPWVPVLFIASVWLLRQLVGTVRWAALERPIVAISLILSLAALLVNAGNFQGLSRLYAHDAAASQASVQLIEGIMRDTAVTEPFVLGPSHAQAEWLAYDRQVLPIPHVRPNWPTFTTWLKNHNIQYVVLDEEVWQRRRQLLGDYWSMTEEGLVANQTPPGWTLLQPGSYPCRTCLLHFDAQVLEPAVVQEITYADKVKLLGYEMPPETPAAGEPVELILYWELLADLTETTHVFIHFLDETGNIVAQDDGPLLVDFAFYPEAEFQAGTLARDVHTIPDLPANTYSVHVGLYVWATQARLPVTDGTAVTSTDYPQLTQLVVP